MATLVIGKKEEPWLLAVEPWAEAYDVPAGESVSIKSKPSGLNSADDEFEFEFPTTEGDRLVFTVWTSCRQLEVIIGRNTHVIDY